MAGKFIEAHFVEKGPIVGILRGNTLEEVNLIAQCYVKAGLYALEITMNTPDVEEIINKISNDYPDLSIGAGTVCNLNDLDRAIDAGSQFIVTPIVDEQVIAKCVDIGIPVFPGAFTPTEIYKAWSLGATAVKIFPATALGPQFVKDILAPLSEIKLLPTGGVSKSNITEFFRKGAYGVGMGSSLIDRKYLTERNEKDLIEHLKAVKRAVKW